VFKPSNSWSFTLVLALLAILGLFVSAIVIWIVSYDSLIYHVLSVTGKFHLEDALRERFFTPEKFCWLRTLLPFLAIATGILVFRFRKKIAAIHIFRHYYADICRAWKNLQPSQKSEVFLFRLVFVYITAKALYYIISTDIQYDEAWSFNYYTANPWYLTPFIYSNYPLHELLTHLTKWLPFPMYVNLRLPVLFTGMAWIFACYCCTARLWGKKAGLLAMAILGTLPPAALYMLQAKGFLMVALFTILLTTVLHLVYIHGWNDTRRRWLVLSVFLGLWSSPVFILPLVIQLLTALMLFSFPGKRTCLKELLIWSFAGILAGMCLYLPVLAGTGIDPLIHAATLHGKSPAHHTMWWHIKFISLWVTGWSGGWVLMGIVLLSLLGMFRGKFKFIGICGVLSLFSIVAVPFITGSYLFPRVWIFLLVPVGWALVYVMLPVLRNLKGVFALIIIFLILNTYSYAVYVERTWSYPWDHTSAEISKLFLKKGVRTYYTDFDYILPIVEFNYRLRKKKIQAYISNESSMQFREKGNLSGIDAIVDGENTDLAIPAGFVLAYRDTIARVYWRP